MLIGLGGAHLLAIQCHMGIYGLWIDMALDEIFRAVIMLIRWHGSRWMNKRIATQEQ
jgi:Na+-driven multidrug efflux pump